ncbi:hypothetical protein [Paracoccus sp. pheM1]|nr:hypothetical protein [Paracoccus sp. pheM1]
MVALRGWVMPLLKRDLASRICSVSASVGGGLSKSSPPRSAGGAA